MVVFNLFSAREPRAIGLAQLVRVKKTSATASETGKVKRSAAIRSESGQLLFIVELKRFFTKFLKRWSGWDLKCIPRIKQ